MNKRIITASLFTLASVCAQAADLVVIVHPSAPKLNKEEVADIFLGKTPSAAPVDLPEADPMRAEFYKKATGRELSQAKAVWSRVVFTGKGLAPKVFPDAASVKKAVAADPKGVGYIEKSAVDSSVKVAFAVE